MEYAGVLERLYRLVPRGMRPGLERVRAAAALLGHPERGLRCVQIGGTNGKGSVACLVAHAARAAGLEVGLFTSPHLHRFSERIRVDGIEASPEVLARHLSRALDVADRESPLDLTFFEVATLAALSIFAEEDVDLAVLEVGLGGRLDATTAAPAAVTAIASVGLDHTEILGNDIARVAREKAGIARPGVPLIVGSAPPKALMAIEGHAGAIGAPVFLLDRDFALPPDLPVPWPGRHQRRNAAVAMAVFDRLAAIDPRCTRHAFREALPSARWPGRYEVVPGRPRHILDGAHNVDGVLALAETLSDEGERPAALVFGTVAGKPAARMLDVLRPLVGAVVLTRPPLGRGLDPSTYAGPADRITADVADALAEADRVAGPDGTVLVAGSLFVVAEARRILMGETCDPPVAL